MISKLVSASKDMMTLLSVVVYFFMMLSVQMFGGLLHEGQEALHETEYMEKHFMVLNCNDPLMALGVWVVMLLCEYEPIFPEAVEKVSKIPFAWTIFPIFWLCGVSIVF